jgi:hypothetical protein
LEWDAVNDMASWKRHTLMRAEMVLDSFIIAAASVAWDIS